MSQWQPYQTFGSQVNPMLREVAGLRLAKRAREDELAYNQANTLADENRADVRARGILDYKAGIEQVVEKNKRDRRDADVSSFAKRLQGTGKFTEDESLLLAEGTVDGRDMGGYFKELRPDKTGKAADETRMISDVSASLMQDTSPNPGWQPDSYENMKKQYSLLTEPIYQKALLAAKKAVMEELKTQKEINLLDAQAKKALRPDKGKAWKAEVINPSTGKTDRMTPEQARDRVRELSMMLANDTAQDPDAVRSEMFRITNAFGVTGAPQGDGNEAKSALAKAREDGYSDEEIAEHLRGAGISEEEIEELLAGE